MAKVQGDSPSPSDLPIDGAAWGATLRSPHPYARIVSIDTSRALTIAGVSCRAHRRGRARQADLRADHRRPTGVRRPTFVRYVGEPVAAVAADHPETCRRALAAIAVEYEVLDPLIDPEVAIDGSHPPIHPDGNVLRHQRDRAAATPTSPATSSSRAPTSSGMQDQAFLGLEAALAIPDDDGAGVELHVATQWLHEDRKQIAACLGLAGGEGAPRARRRRRRVRRPRGHQPAGAHLPARAARSAARCACTTAGRRASSATSTATRRRIWMRHHATADGEIVKIEARFVLDGGAYASTSSAVLLNAITHAQGPYRCPNAVVDGYVGAHQPPAVRGDARLRRRAGVLRPREPDGQARRGVRARPGRDPPAQRDGDRRPADHRAGGGERGAGGPLHPRDGGPAAARAAVGRRRRRHRPDAPARAAPGAPPTRPRACAASAGAWRSRT